MRTPILMMLALTVLLGLALGWFTKGVSPAASHAARGPVVPEAAAPETRPDAAVAAFPAATAAETAERIEAAAAGSRRGAPASLQEPMDTPSESAEPAADADPVEPVAPPREPSDPEVIAARTPSEPPPVSPPPRSPGEPPAFTADPALAAIPPDPEAGDLYVVKEGDSLSNIAKRRYGRLRDYRRIYEENRDRIVDPNNIYPGQTLLLPNPR